MGTDGQRELIDRLAALENDLLDLDGVTGIGVGGTAERGVVHVYVSPSAPAHSVEQVGRLLRDTPFEIVGMGLPTSHQAPGGTGHEQSER